MVFESRRATSSSSAPRRGASRRSPTTACSCRPRRASRARCPSGTATVRGARSSSAARSARSRASSCRDARRRGETRLRERARPRRARPRNLSRTSRSRPRRRARCRATGRSSSSATSTSSATGACASSRRSARACTRPGRRPCSRALEERTPATSRDLVRRRHRVPRCPSPTSRRRSRLFLPGRRRGRGPGRREPRRVVAVRRALPRERGRARSSCRGGPGPAHRRSGRSASAPRTCSRSPSRYGSFPILLETYRECLRDVFDLPGLVELLAGSRPGRIRVVTRRLAHAVAVRRVAAVLVRRQLHLRRRRAARRAPRAGALGRSGAAARAARRGRAARAARPRGDRGDSSAGCSASTAGASRDADGLHDLLLVARRSERGGDPRPERSLRPRRRGWIAVARRASGRDRRVHDRGRAPLRRRRGRRALPRRARRRAAARAARGLPRAGRRSARRSRLALRAHARPVPSRGRRGAPSGSASARCGSRSSASPSGAACSRASSCPAGGAREWCDAEVLRSLKRRSLASCAARSSRSSPPRSAASSPSGRVSRAPRAGSTRSCPSSSSSRAPDSRRRCSRPRSCPRAIERYRPADLDMLCAAGRDRLDRHRAARPDRRPHRALPDGPAPAARAAARDAAPRASSRPRPRACSPRAARSSSRTSSAETGAFPADLLDGALGPGVGRRGHQRHPRAAAQLPARATRRERTADALARERALPLAAARPARQRGPLVSHCRRSRARPPPETERRAALARALLERHGVLTREAVAAEGIAGGFSAVYEVLKAMEEAGHVRRGYFVAGLGATQFALPGADDRLRACASRRSEPRAAGARRDRPGEPLRRGAALADAKTARAGRSARRRPRDPLRRRADRLSRPRRADLLTFLPPPSPSARGRPGARARARRPGRPRAPARLPPAEIDGKDPRDSVLAPYLAAAGFFAGSRGYLKRLSSARILSWPLRGPTGESGESRVLSLEASWS